jgi:ATP adenylyltransferase
MPLDHLWATWRSNYVTGVVEQREAAVGEASELSLFEQILQADGSDRDKGVVVQNAHTFVLLNRFPYTSGHLMVLPKHAVASLDDLDDDVHAELWVTVRAAVAAQERAFRCDGINVGLNLGEAAGGSQSDHLHVHCVPRWIGDANFMSVSAETRVLPVSLDDAWDRLTEVWEDGSDG